MTAKDDHEGLPSEKTAGDLLHTVAKSTIAMIPGFGGPVAELLAFVVGPPLDKRRDEWMARLAQKLDGLQGAHQRSLQDLANSPEFIDTFVQASRVAISTSNARKQDALRNAVLNVAAGCSLDENNRQMFLRMIDEFTPGHLRVLQVLHDPSAALGQRIDQFRRLTLGSSMMQLIRAVVPASEIDDDLCLQLAKELKDKGLIVSGEVKTMMTVGGLLSSHTTARGTSFISYISDPSA